MTSIDIHNHVTPAAYIKAVREFPARMGSHIERDERGREWLIMVAATTLSTARITRRHGNLGSGGVDQPFTGPYTARER